MNIKRAEVGFSEDYVRKVAKKERTNMLRIMRKKKQGQKEYGIWTRDEGGNLIRNDEVTKEAIADPNKIRAFCPFCKEDNEVDTVRGGIYGSGLGPSQNRCVVCGRQFEIGEEKTAKKNNYLVPGDKIRMLRPESFIGKNGTFVREKEMDGESLGIVKVDGSDVEYDFPFDAFEKIAKKTAQVEGDVDTGIDELNTPATQEGVTGTATIILTSKGENVLDVAKAEKLPYDMSSTEVSDEFWTLVTEELDTIHNHPEITEMQWLLDVGKSPTYTEVYSFFLKALNPLDLLSDNKTKVNDISGMLWLEAFSVMHEHGLVEIVTG